MAIQVAINDLSNWLELQSENTPQTPYELEITGLTLNTVKNLPLALKNNPLKYVDLSSTVIRQAWNLYLFFENCTSLVTAPQLPNMSINANVSYCFYNCTSLVSVANIPNYTSLEGFFLGCSSLTNCPDIPNNVTNLNRCFRGCTSLVTTPRIPDSVINMEFCFYDCTSLSNVTNLPNNQNTSLDYCFYNCTSLVNLPNIPSGITSLFYTFANTGVVTTPIIPDSVKYMYGTFTDCASLTTVSNVPKNVTNLYDCFDNCRNLTTIYNFGLSVNDFYNSTAKNCFYNCNSLTSIYVNYDESDDWHVYRLKFNSSNVSGKVYDKTKTATTIASRQISGTDLKLPVLSDELLFSDSISDADLDALIEDVLTYKYTYTGDSTSVINPKHRSFVLWADRIVTNLSFPSDVSHASGVLSVANGGTGQTTQENVNKAIIGVLSSGSSDVTDGTEFVSSYASDNGFSDTNAPNVPYKRQFVKVWNYIKGKISSVLKITLAKHIIKGTTYTTNTYADSNPKIEFHNSDDSQNISLTFTDYDAVQSPASLTLNGNQGGEYFIAPNIKATGSFYGALSGNATTATAASSATAASRLGSISITNIRIGSAQAKITLQQLMTWLITTKQYIPSGVDCYKVFGVPWEYANNDILQFSANGANFELQLAGCLIEFMGNATNYNTGRFRLRIHSSPRSSFTVTSGYLKFPESRIAEYTCNNSDYSPTWKIVGTDEKYANGYWGMTDPYGSDNVWIRSTSQGILPYQSGNAGNGHCSLGTSSWYWEYAYIDNIYGNLYGAANRIRVGVPSSKTDGDIWIQ